MNKFDSLRNLTSKIGSGATPTGGQSNYKIRGVSLIRSQNVLDMRFSKDGLAFIDDVQASKLDNVKVQENDILLNITGDSIARVCKVPKEILPARVNQHVSIIRTNGKIDTDYLLYYLIFRKNYLLTISRVGGTRNALTKDAVEAVQIRLDDNSKKIASVLSALDDKIELNSKINAELEAMAKTLYDYWFVQFDFPNAEGKPYKSSGGEMVYDEVLKREIPKGWEVKSLFDTCDVQYGFPFSTSHFNEEKVGKPVIRIRDILENSISTYSSQDNIEEKYKLFAGDLLVGMDGNFHLNFWSKTDCYLNQRVVRIRKMIGFLPNFVTLYQIEPFIKLREKSVSRTTVGHLSDKDLKSIKMLVPTKALSENLKVFDDLLSKTVSSKKQNQELAYLRDWLLPMLMNGQVRVVGAHEEVEVLRQAQDDKLGMVAGDASIYQINNNDVQEN